MEALVLILVFVLLPRTLRLDQGFTQRLPLKRQNYIQLTCFHHDWRPDKHLHLSSSCCGGVAQTVSQPPAPNLYLSRPTSSRRKDGMHFSPSFTHIFSQYSSFLFFFFFPGTYAGCWYLNVIFSRTVALASVLLYRSG